MSSKEMETALELTKEILKKFKILRKCMKELQTTDCHCSAEETTGWTTFRLCNICGKIQEKK